MSATAIIKAEPLNMSASSQNPLAKLDKARQMLAESRTLEEVKQIKDLAEGAKVYAKAAHLGRETQNYAAEIALLAARKAGEILKELQKTPKQSAAKAAGDSEYRKTLKETNTPERTAQVWQNLAEPNDKTFQSAINKTTLAGKELTTAAVLREIKTRPPKPEKDPLDQLMDWLGTRMPNPAPCDGEPVGTSLLKMAFELPKTAENEKRFGEVVAYLEKISKFYANHADNFKSKKLV